MTQIVPSVTVPVTTPVPGTQLTPADVARLAREVGLAMRDLEDILVRFNITAETYEKLKTHEWFNKLVDEYRIEWQSTTNTMTRTQLEALHTAEQAIPHLYARAISGKEPLNHATDTIRLLTDIAGLKKTPAQGTQNERFQITINLGADTKIEFDGSRLPIDGTGAPAPLAIPLVDDKEERV
jgi:hypothetical protein